jgi:ubiquinone/menaquinone biosynthesis C-methylase UbiE
MAVSHLRGGKSAKMSNNQSSKHINDFSDYRLTGDLRITSEATAKQVACYKHLLKPLGKKSSILDDACRDGRIALPLSPFYKKITGVDANEKLIEIAEASSTEQKNLQFLVQDIRKLSFPDNSFDGVLSAFSSWGFYGPEGDLQSLREMKRVLKPGGVFLMDWGNIEHRLREMAEQGVYNENLKHKVIYELFETPKGEAVVRTSWMDKDRTFHWICQKVGYMDPLIVGMQQGYNPIEVKEMFNTVGLHILEIYGNYDYAPVSDTYNRFIIKAVK